MIVDCLVCFCWLFILYRFMFSLVYMLLGLRCCVGFVCILWLRLGFAVCVLLDWMLVMWLVALVVVVVGVSFVLMV